MKKTFLIPGIDHEVVTFVMRRQQASGGFGLAPTLPASVEDTYHAIRILKAILPPSGNGFDEVTGNPKLKSFLVREEDRETWCPKTAYQYLFLCRLCGVLHEGGWPQRFVAERLRGKISLQDRYYLAKILREFPDAAPMDEGLVLAGGQAEAWETVEELWMWLSLHKGEPEALHTTAEVIIRWVQACQNPDGGFGFLPGTTSFIENSHWCLRSLTALSGAVLSGEMARDFILRCKTRRGGFSRKNGAAPFLYATWHAVESLSLLRILSRGP
jgi:hypothetical protein